MQNSGHEEEGKEFGGWIGGGADESAFWNSRSAEDETPSSHDKTVSPPHRRRYKRCLSRRSVSFSAHHLTMDVDNSLPNGPYLPCDIFGGSTIQFVGVTVFAMERKMPWASCQRTLCGEEAD